MNSKVRRSCSSTITFNSFQYAFQKKRFINSRKDFSFSFNRLETLKSIEILSELILESKEIKLDE